MRLAPASLLLLLAAATWPVDGAAQVRRCETADGRTIYTDKACQDIGAVDRLPRGGDAGVAALHRRQCSRTLQDLTFELTMAIDHRDTNRLAALYHWPGTGTRNGYAIMGRLDAIAQRPLVDARPLFPVDTPSVPAPARIERDPSRPPSSSEIMRSARPWQPAPAAPAAGTTPSPVPVDEAPAKRRAPYALQVDQTLANGSTPSRTVFGLRRHLGCWWLSL